MTIAEAPAFDCPELQSKVVIRAVEGRDEYVRFPIPLAVLKSGQLSADRGSENAQDNHELGDRLDADRRHRRHRQNC
jgi:hypothetical protein